MSLIEHTLFGDVDKVQVAIDRIKQFEPPEGYYMAFSGGKDSETVYRLTEMADVKFDAHYSQTGIDPPELVQFVREHYPDVVFEKPEHSVFWAMIHGWQTYWPPQRQVRWCCELLKEQDGRGRFVLTGIRWQESTHRRQRQMTDACPSAGKRFLHPIIDWTDDDVWGFIRQEKLPYCSLYDEGFDRIGCILCPMSSNVQRDIERWPKFANAWKVALGRLVKIRKERGLKCTFANGEEFFDWWIARSKKATSDEQPPLFV